MRARDVAFLAAGMAAGAGLAWLASPSPEPREPTPHSAVPVVGADQRRRAGPDPPPPSPDADRPTHAATGSGATAVSSKAAGIAEALAELQRLRAERAGAAVEAPGTATSYRGNPFAGMDRDALATRREEADREAAPLLEKWRAASPGKERAAAMKALSMPLRRLLEAGGSMEHLLLLEDAAERGETPEERRAAVVATHTLWQPEVVDFLLQRTRSPHPEVRLYAYEGLCWVAGAEKARAVEAAVAGLEDEDPGVRAVTALSLATIVGDPALAPRLRDRLLRETDPKTAEAMRTAAERLESPRGR